MSIFSKYINGDGNEVLLPKTRFKSFGFYGKEHFWTLVFVSVICGVFFVPSLVWLYVMNYGKAQFVNGLDVNVMDYAESLSTYLRSYTLTTYSVLIIGIVIFFVGLSGAFTCVKRACFAEDVSLGYYFNGIKQNGLRFCLFGAIWGVAYMLFRVNLLFVASSTVATVFVRATAIVLFVLVNVVIMYCCMQTVVYNVKLGALFKNAVILTFTKLPTNLLAIVVVAVPYLLTLIIPSPFQLLALLLLSLLYIGFATLGLGCYCNVVFDKTINVTLGDDYIGRGLYKEPKE